MLRTLKKKILGNSVCIIVGHAYGIGKSLAGLILVCNRCGHRRIPRIPCNKKYEYYE